MKALIFVVTFCIVGASFAAEVETQCPAMNQSREKIVKTIKTKSAHSKGSSQQ